MALLPKNYGLLGTARWVLLPGFLLIVAPTAWAGGGTSTGGEMDTGGETDTGEEPSETDTGGGEEEETGDCGSCTPPAESMWFESPEDGASVESPFEITIGKSYWCYCDDCGCFSESIGGVDVFVDGELYLDDVSGATVELSLAPGTHQLVLMEAATNWVESAPLTVTVVAGEDEGGSEESGTGGGESGTDGGESGTGGGESGTGGGESGTGGGEGDTGGGESGMADDGGGGGGGGCAVVSSTSPALPLGLLAILGLWLGLGAPARRRE